MSETFTLKGAAPAAPAQRRRRSPWWWLAALLAVAAAAWLIARALHNRAPHVAGVTQQALARAQERKEALQRLLPGARLPEPFEIRGAARAERSELVWLRYDYLDSHAFLIAADEPAVPELAALLGQMTAEFLPARQLIDESGVLPEKRPPFVEEFRTVPLPEDPAAPPTAWAQGWDPAGWLAAPGAFDFPVAAGQSFPASGYQRSDGHWWTLVDLSDLRGQGVLYLVHAVKDEAVGAPGAAPLFDFLAEMLRAGEGG